MTNSINLQDLVKHIVNGTLGHSICRVCLLPLKDFYENIYTTICKEDNEYRIADVLEEVCDIKISSTDEFKICTTCFIAASQAYKFYLMAKRSNEVIHYYVKEINNQINSGTLDKLKSDSLCITLPVVLPSMVNFDFNINKYPFKSLQLKTDNASKSVSKESTIKNLDYEDDIVMMSNENGKHTFYKPQIDGSLKLLDDSNIYLDEFLKQLPETEPKKKRRKRNPMEYKMCSQCPVRYRFVRKLKEHMKDEHGVDLFVCKVCQAVIESEQEFKRHLQTHTGVHTCAVCNMVFKKRDTIISHFKWHEEMKLLSQLESTHVCEVCGLLFRNAEDLQDHHEKKHVKKFTCYYCGRMYKGEISFELHIKKHETNNHVKKEDEKIKIETRKRRRKYTCPRCGRDFVDERALLYHERLHTNERPYACDVCGRGFVSLNRRNQHAVCAHTAPARRCPLCPALFHLRSMVNTHIKKVHLKTHKRRNRSSKHQNVFWKTEPVPIQELSVSIQNEILELQAAQKALQAPKL